MELARRIARREVSSVEVFEAHRARHDEVHAQINAIVLPRWQEARAEAEAADRAVAQQQELGPLHGVPITVKECFHVPGMQSTIGLTTRVGKLDRQESILVTRLRAAGAVLLGKTNIPQLMIWHECDNPVYGCTNSPVDLARSPGGSTGGEAAAIATGCSPLGLGNDLGGSIRLPAAWNGLYGLKPTSYRLTNRGTTGCFRGEIAMITQPGPLARTVEDCDLALRLLVGDMSGFDIAPIPLRRADEVSIRGLRIGVWDDDGYFPACAAAKRAVREAADALAAQGAIVEWIKPPLADIIWLYYAIMGSDGGQDARDMARGSKLDHRVARMLYMAKVSRPFRWGVVQSLAASGQTWLAHVVRNTGATSAHGFWKLCEQLGAAIQRFYDEVFQRCDLVLCPPHALPAMPHGAAIDLLPAASYAFFANLLGIPAGVVPWTTVRADETSSTTKSRDITDRRVRETLENAAGLPIGVQLAAPAWHDHVVLAAMQKLESIIRQRDENRSSF